MKPRSQIVATAAFERINSRTTNTSEDNKKYATLVHKLPTMILQNGLAQTTGFLLAKNERHHQVLLEDLILIFKEIDTNFREIKDGKGFHSIIIQSDLYPIMSMTRKALEISGWLRRYVQGILKIGADGNLLEACITTEQEEQ